MYRRDALMDLSFAFDVQHVLNAVSIVDWDPYDSVLTSKILGSSDSGDSPAPTSWDQGGTDEFDPGDWVILGLFSTPLQDSTDPSPPLLSPFVPFCGRTTWLLL